MLFPYTYEMVFLVLDENAYIFQVDTVMFKFRMAVGPFTMSYTAVKNTGYNIKMQNVLVINVKTNLPGSNYKPGIR